MRYFALVLAAALLPFADGAHAQGFKPTRPVEVVVHTGPGGGSDVYARLVTAMLESNKLLPVRTVVVNKPGGGGAVALSYLAEKKGDPHTIGVYGVLWISMTLISAEVRVPFKEMTPIANLINDVELMVVRNDSAYRTLGDFIEAARKNPRQLRQTGGSIEARGNLVRQMLQRQTGTSWQYIPFPGGGDRIAAVLGGHAQIIVAGTDEIREHLNAATLRPIAQVAAKRLPAYPDVATVSESFKIPHVISVRGVIGPPGMPQDAAAYYEGVFSRLVKTAAWRKYLADSDAEDGYLGSSDLARLADEVMAQRRQIYGEVGIKMVR